MTGAPANIGELSAATPALIIPREIVACLPETLLEQLAQMPEAKQAEFIKAFQHRSRSLAFAYLSSLIYCHYGLLGRWAMTGILFLSLFIAATVGWIWWLIDLVRMPEMVREHNRRVATEILRQLNAPSDPAPLAGA
jgi:hypothetical protein